MVHQSVGLLFLVALVGGVRACSDRKENVIKLVDGDSKNLVITTVDGAGLTYDKKNQPSCHGSEPVLDFPGAIRPTSGLVKVARKVELNGGKSRGLLTLKKNAFMIGTVCQDGVSKHRGVPSKYCTVDACKLAPGLCTVLETPGQHNLAELEHSIGNNGTIFLPGLSPFLKGIIKGEWKVEVKIVDQRNSVVAHLKVPAGDGWVYLQAD